ncbi:MAG: glycerol-3-phosphate 1-O-acyltransferase PlsY [Firmicutes bacterium]|nr:glycerol-3-phosphate 1-O-acyltransferase PlsY [Candidatus Fermentithermobacillaceae bacterium]
MRIAGVCFLSYLAGAVPFGFLVAKLRGVGDIRLLGSGNIGATNVMRVLGPSWGALVLVLDAAKGAFGAWLGLTYLPWGSMGGLLTGLMAVAGHNWPVFLRFKGGKGVAASLGVVLSVYPGLALFASAVFSLTVLISRYVSLGSLVASWAAFVATLFSFGYDLFDRIAVAAFCILITVRHRDNIRRLISGTERKLGKFSRKV